MRLKNVLLVEGDIEHLICIEYTNGRKALKYYGSNAFPFNFDEFAEFMGEIS